LMHQNGPGEFNALFNYVALYETYAGKSVHKIKYESFGRIPLSAASLLVSP